MPKQPKFIIHTQHSPVLSTISNTQFIAAFLQAGNETVKGVQLFPVFLIWKDLCAAVNRTAHSNRGVSAVLFWWDNAPTFSAVAQLISDAGTQWQHPAGPEESRRGHRLCCGESYEPDGHQLQQPRGISLSSNTIQLHHSLHNSKVFDQLWGFLYLLYFNNMSSNRCVCVCMLLLQSVYVLSCSSTMALASSGHTDLPTFRQFLVRILLRNSWGYEIT